jgi:Na+/melibiose symporter-like transporter
MLYNQRFFLAAAGSLAISGIALPLVGIIGKGNEQTGYFGAMCVLGLSGVVLLFVCFFTTKSAIPLRSSRALRWRKT